MVNRTKAHAHFFSRNRTRVNYPNNNPMCTLEHCSLLNLLIFTVMSNFDLYFIKIWRFEPSSAKNDETCEHTSVKLTTNYWKSDDFMMILTWSTMFCTSDEPHSNSPVRHWRLIWLKREKFHFHHVCSTPCWTHMKGADEKS